MNLCLVHEVLNTVRCHWNTQDLSKENIYLLVIIPVIIHTVMGFFPEGFPSSRWDHFSSTPDFIKSVIILFNPFDFLPISFINVLLILLIFISKKI